MTRAGFGRSIEGTVTTGLQDAIAANGGGLITTRQNAKYLSGARTVVKVNDRIFGFCFAVSWNVETDYTEIRTIDNPMPYELGPKRVSVSGTLSSWVLPGQSPQAEVMQSDMLSFIFNRYITIEVSDSSTGNIIFKTDRAMIVRSRGRSSPDSLSQMELEWRAIDWMNEQKPEYPETDGSEIKEGAGFDVGNDPNKQGGGGSGNLRPTLNIA